MFILLKKILRAVMILGCVQGFTYARDIPNHVIRFVYEAAGWELSSLDDERERAPQEEQNNTDANILLGLEGVHVNKDDLLTPLFRAVQAGDIKLATWLLQLGADVDAEVIPSTLAKTALEEAVDRGDMEMAQLLIDHGANPNHRFGWSGTSSCLQLAINHKDTAMVRLLRRQRATLDTQLGAEALHLAVRRDHTEMVKALVEEGCVGVNERHGYSTTPLRNAIEHGNAAMVRLLIDLGAQIDLVGYPDREYPKGGWRRAIELMPWEILGILLEARVLRNSPLTINEQINLFCLISDSRNLEEAILFLESRLQVCVEELKENGTPIIHIAAKNGCEALVRFLINTREVNVRHCFNESGETALHWAARYSNREVVEFLINNRGDINRVNNAGRGILDYVADRDQHNERRGILDFGVDRDGQIIRLLVEEGINVNQRTQAGYTPLTLTALRGDPDTMNFLRQNGADIHHLAMGYTLLQLAVIGGNVDIIALLLQPPGWGFDINALDDQGQTLLDLAVEESHAKCIRYFTQTLNAPFNPANPRTWAAFYRALLYQYYLKHATDLRRPSRDERVIEIMQRDPIATQEVVNEFVRNLQAHVQTVGTDGWTPLRRLFELIDQDTAPQATEGVALLIGLGADVNLPDPNGDLPLHLAADARNPEIARLLLNRSAPMINQLNQDGDAPLHLAIRRGMFDRVRLLVVDFRADVNVNVPRANDDDTPLHLAVNMRDLQLVRFLLRHDANPNQANRAGRTPLTLAAHDPELTELLNTPREVLEAQDNDEVTAAPE